MKSEIRLLIVACGVLVLFFVFGKTHFPEKNEVMDVEIIKEQKMPAVRVVPVSIVTLPKPVKVKKTAPAKKEKQKQPTKQTPPPTQKAKVQKASHKMDSQMGRGKSGNADPMILARYDLPISQYLAHMRSMGAQVGIWDRYAKRFACGVATDGRFTSRVRQDGMSVRARILTKDFPNSRALLDKVTKLFGVGDYEILLLNPQGIDEKFYNNIYRFIREAGKNPQDIASVHVVYKSAAKGLAVSVEQLELGDGTVHIDRIFLL